MRRKENNLSQMLRPIQPPSGEYVTNQCHKKYTYFRTNRPMTKVFIHFVTDCIFFKNHIVDGTEYKSQIVQQCHQALLEQR